MALCPGPPGWAGTRKVKPIWILLMQETVSGSGISWAMCKSTPRSRQITTPTPKHSVFTGQMPFLLPNQQRQCAEGKWFLSVQAYEYPRVKLWLSLWTQYNYLKNPEKFNILINLPLKWRRRLQMSRGCVVLAAICSAEILQMTNHAPTWHLCDLTGNKASK